MSINRIAKRTEKILLVYEKFLDKIAEKDFQTNPKPGVWSYAEVYSHIFSANQACLMAIDNCMNGKAEETSEKASISGRLILFVGLFPPVKIKAPARIAAMVQKISKEEAARQVQQFRVNFQKKLPYIAGASATQKARHPRLGFFDAKQWLRFIEIHTLHHKKQLYRIQSALKKS